MRELPVVGGQLALDFANTVDDPDGPARYDHAGTYPELLDWAVRLGTLTSSDARRLRRTAAEHPRKAAAALRRAHRLRQLLLAVFTDAATGGTAVASHWQELRPYVAEAYGQAVLRGGDPAYDLNWTGDRLDAVLWPVARAASDLLTSPELGRVKRCAGCPWVFLDRSRNGSRRWCSMEDCGTHEKIQRYVARRAARRR